MSLPMSVPMNAPKPHLLAICCAFCLLLPPISLLASKAVVPLLLITAALACLAVWHAERRVPRPDRGTAMMFAALLLLCAIASLWGFAVVGSLFLTLRVGAIFAAGLVLFTIAQSFDDGMRNRIGHWLLAGVLATLAIMTVEIVLGFPLFQFIKGSLTEDANLRSLLNRGATALAMLTWPTAILLWQRGFNWAPLALAVLVAELLSILSSGAALLGFVAGGLTVLVALGNRKASHALVVAATVSAFVGMPAAAKLMYGLGWHQTDWLFSSARHRIEIWSYTTQLIEQKPWYGWGFDASRAITGARAESLTESLSLLPLHPHSAPLQILFELGIPGVALTLVLLWLLARRIEVLPRPARVCGQALFMTTLTIACTAYGVWQNQWLAMMFSAALMIPLTLRSPSTAAQNAPDRTGSSGPGISGGRD